MKIINVKKIIKNDEIGIDVTLKNSNGEEFHKAFDGKMWLKEENGKAKFIERIEKYKEKNNTAAKNGIDKNKKEENLKRFEGKEI